MEIKATGFCVFARVLKETAFALTQPHMTRCLQQQQPTILSHAWHFKGERSWILYAFIRTLFENSPLSCYMHVGSCIPQVLLFECLTHFKVNRLIPHWISIQLHLTQCDLLEKVAGIEISPTGFLEFSSESYNFISCTNWNVDCQEHKWFKFSMLQNC